MTGARAGGGLPVGAVPGPLRHDPEQVRQQAEQLLTQPPYIDQEPGLLNQASRWLGDRIAALLSQSALDGFGQVLAWTLAVVGVGALIFVVWRLTRGTVAGHTAPSVVPSTAARRSAASWHEAADAYEAQGDRTEALRARYTALVATLIEQGTIDEIPGRTVGELDAQVARAAPDIASAVADAGERFERGIYGRRPVSATDLADVAAAARMAGAARSGRRARVAR